MNEFHEMVKKVVLYSLILSCIASIIGFMIATNQWISVLGGLWIGTIMALAGFGMIVRLSYHLPSEESQGKKQGTIGYITRYLFYGVVMFVSYKLGFSIVALLVGVICHKGSIILYAALEKRREDSRA